MCIIIANVGGRNGLIDYLHYLMGLTGGGIHYWLGGYDQSLKFLISIVIVDYITGLLSAFVLKELNSKLGHRGILRKIGLFLSIVIAHLADEVLGSQGMIRLMAIWFYISKEGISAVENLAQAGVPIPKALKKALQQIQEK
ncbi:phage holin family protein [Natroniella sulfidigena]|uniref:phage holin family protein n=1 Tax=Natroniella sulfidigena TaxID=723921 RepID=UPI00200B4751|nr:phage holin family protein [Natroniella sulfidigena]MCK8816764.1 phage holin family protein [Natroniella sulfidigena]